jgi:hypothetical protein
LLHRDFGLAHPVLLVGFPDGSSFSVEFDELASGTPADAPASSEGASRGAWIEFRTSDIEATVTALRAAGTPEFTHPGSSHAYFRAPGGQVFRIVDGDQ